MEQTRVARFVLLSAFGTGDTASKASRVARFLYRTVMSKIFADKVRAEAALPGSGLSWTIAYPVILNDTGNKTPLRVQTLETVGKVPGLPNVPRTAVANALLDLAANNNRPGERILITRGQRPPARPT